MTAKSTPRTAVAADTKPKKVFVVSPIGAPGTDIHRKASYALKYIFREALKGEEWDVHRADEGKSPDSIGQHVIKRLFESDLVIADLTGHNPNVFYELAIAHGWRKPVVHLISKGEKVPFDIVDQRTIFYDITDLESVEEAVVTLREYAEYALEHVDELVNPLTSFEMFSQIRADQADGGDAVADALEQVVARLSRMESRIGGRVDPRYQMEFAVDNETYAFPPAEFADAVSRYALFLTRSERATAAGDTDRADAMNAELEKILHRVPPSRRNELKARAMARHERRSRAMEPSEAN